jgi:hypothetical protein
MFMFDLPIEFTDLQECCSKQEQVFFTPHLRTFSRFFSCSLPVAGIITLPAKEDYQVYAQLPCADAERAKIIDLITTIGTKGKIDILLNHKGRLEKLGSEINEKVHPLKFLAVIFSNPQLKNYMGSIRHDYFKWSNFIHGLAKRINLEAKKGKVLKFVDDFSLEIHGSSDDIRCLCEKKDWEGLVEYLINH